MIEELLEIVSAAYHTVIFADIRSILQDPDLRQALEEQGLLTTLGPAGDAIKAQADLMVLAQRSSRALGVLRGSLDAPELVSSLKSPDTEVESERYGAFEILKVQVAVPFFTLNVPISFLDDTTAIFAISLSPEHPSIDEVKAALDRVAGSKPGFLADPSVKELFQRAPVGFAMVVARTCRPLGQYEGCQGLAASAIKEDDHGVVNWVFEFSSPEMAQGALPAIRQRIANLEGPLTSERIIEGSQRGNIVRIRATVDISEALSGAIGSAVP